MIYLCGAFSKTIMTMKRIVIPFVMAVILTGIIVSCHKGPVPNNGGNDQPTDSILPGNDSIIPGNDTIIPVSNLVTFGDTIGMLVKTYPENNHIEDVDLNDDGQPDVQFYSELVGSAGLGHDIVTTLKCKNKRIELLGDIIQQKKYLHIDSTFHSEDSIWWVIGVYHIYTCVQMAETDSVVSVTEKLALFANDANESFDETNTFMSTNVILKNWSYSFPGGTEGGDHCIIHHEYSYHDDCNYFPKEEEKYIGFKYKENQRTHLGWMKIILHYDHVELLETAIQR